MTSSNKQITGRILDLMSRDDSIDAPADSVNWAKNIFRRRVVEPKATFTQKILAVLQMDISPQKAAFGERSAGLDQARQMLFEAGDNGIDLRITDKEGTFEIRGQVLGEGFTGGTVELVGAKNRYETAIDEMSEFRLAWIAGGKYSLTIRNEEKELVIEGIDIT